MRAQHITGLRDVMRINKMPDGIKLTKEQILHARWVSMRKGLRYLLEYVLIHARSGCTTAQALEAAHHVTRPELLKDPALGAIEMERLADMHTGDGMAEFYAFAGDVFHYGDKGDGSDLHRFIWETPRTKVQIALELMALLSVETNTTMGRTMIEIDQALRDALGMLGAQPDAPKGETAAEEPALVAAGVDEDDWTPDWMRDLDEGDRS